MDINRIVAHTDFDGLVSALLLQELLGVEEVVFVEPWQLRDGLFTAHKTDAVVDLPYPPGGCGLWIDHHATSARKPAPHEYFDAGAKSCPSVIIALYPGASDRLSRFFSLIAAADKIDSANYTEEDLRSPNAAMQIAAGMDSGRPQRDDYYKEWLLDQLRQHSLEEVAASSLVRERFIAAQRLQEETLAALEERMTLRGNVLLVDMMGLGMARPALLPFLLYQRYPSSSVTLTVRESEEPGRLHVSAGENIFNRVNRVDIGKLMQEFGGGGHKQAGGCTIPAAQRDELLDRMILVLNENE